MIRRGLKPKPAREVALHDIEDVRIEAGTINSFYRTATLEIVSHGAVAMRLRAVKDPETFQRAILNAKVVRGKASAEVDTAPEKKA